eukprot:s3282_g1.t1
MASAGCPEQSDSSSEDLDARCEVTLRILTAPRRHQTFALPSNCTVADLELDDDAGPVWSTRRGRLKREDRVGGCNEKSGNLMTSPGCLAARGGGDPSQQGGCSDAVHASGENPSGIEPRALLCETLVDVALDLGLPPVLHERKPGAHGANEVTRREVRADELTEEELEAINQHQLLSGRWTSDNRSGVAGTLHRISRNVDPTDGSVVGITIRMAHAQYGMLDQVSALKRSLQNKKLGWWIFKEAVRALEDNLKRKSTVGAFNFVPKSLLVLGPPGSGKTTLLREVARLHDEEFQHRVVIVDTSSEIAGFGKVRHPAVGRTTRRRKVADRDKQYKDMLEAVQNDTPQVLVIDEIGSASEVEAACSIGFRGIVLVATAHACSLQEAMNNPTLQPLFGSFEKSTIGDEMARRTPGGRKFVEERRNEPVFQSLVELGQDAGDQWILGEARRLRTIYTDLKAAVDGILSKKSPQPMFHQPSGGYSQESSGQRLRPTNGPQNLCEQLLPIVSVPQITTGLEQPPWLYSPHASAEQMEYAALLIGVRGVFDSLGDLNPPAQKIFIEGDCRHLALC